MPEMLIEQALLESSRGGWTITARSPGWDDDWNSAADRLCAGFGQPPPLEHLPLCAWAQPLDRQRVAVVQAAAEGAPPMLRFRLLVLPRALYARIGDPFAISDEFPPPWGTRVVLPSLPWRSDEPDCDVERLQRILQDSDSATLLGGVQALVDGGRIVFERPFPAPELIRRLWALLPTPSRAELWPASFVFAANPELHAVVVPKYSPTDWPGFLTEEQAGDYPQGRYELNLQIAIEAGDQREVDRLFRRRTSRQTLHLAIALLLIATAVAIALRVL
jgi:hypothetical protein